MDSFMLICKHGLESVLIKLHNGACYEELVHIVRAKWPTLDNVDISFFYSIPGHDRVFLSNQEEFSCIPILVSAYGLKVVEMKVSVQSFEKGKVVEMNVAAQSSEKGKVVEINVFAQSSEMGKVVEMDVSAQSSEKGVSLSELDRYHGTDMGNAKRANIVRTSKGVTEIHECEDLQNEERGVCLTDICITDLPSSIFISILSSLPLNCVLICRGVCKTWRNLIKDSEFVKLHFSRAEAYPLIRNVGPKHVSRILYFVDQPPKFNPRYDIDCCECPFSMKLYCECYLKIKLDSKLKIPLHNAELAMNGEKEANTNLPLKRKRVTKLRSKVHKLNLINSCNGFLCLSEPYHDDPVMVCNPITGEFINLPLPTKSDQEFINCGLGFCPKTNQYKVVRMFGQEGREMNIEPVTGRTREYCRMVEIHTLGTKTWKMVGYAPSLPRLGKSTYLDGTLNWLDLLSYNSSVPYYIASFDIGEEKFQSIPIPPKRYGQLGRFDNDRLWLGELRGCLCISDASDAGIEKIELWVMKTYGVESSWKMEIKIDISSLKRGLRTGPYEPMSYFKDGTVLLFHSWSGSIFCYDPKNKKLNFLKVYGIKTRFEAISYIPSFIALKNAMVGDDVEVLNVKSRFGDLKLQGESRDVSLVLESEDWASNTSSCSEDYYDSDNAND